jgi:hypothetical protein
MPDAGDYPAKHWRMRAEEAHALADRAVADEVKDSWLRVAESYEALARAAEQRERFARGNRHAGGTEGRKETG